MDNTNLSVRRLGALILMVAAMFLAGAGWSQGQTAAPAKVQLKLISGDTISGQPAGVKDGSLAVTTDYGVIRVPVADITPESRAALGIVAPSGADDAAAARNRDLEAMVSRLRAENADLRRQLAANGQGGFTPVPTATTSLTPSRSSPPAAEGGAYWMSSTGKRHNARCRYYGTGKGRACGPNEGVACKICGG